MLDYHLVEALAAVLDEGGFERAADRLCITQSAVSQRIKQLEDLVGKVLIVRESPPRATEPGELLLRHYRQVFELEEGTLDAISAKREGRHPHVPIAVNTDSLLVWFMEAIIPFLRRSGATIEVFVDGHERTIDLLKSGAAAGCISSERRTVQGCTAELIGDIRYVLVASSDFAAKWFPDGFTRAAAAKAPIINLDRNDKLQYDALFRAFGEPQLMPPACFVPSPDQYVLAVTAGLGYALVPEIKAAEGLAAGRLVELDERVRMGLTLYWHRWKYYSPLLQEISDVILAEGGRILAGKAIRP